MSNYPDGLSPSAFCHMEGCLRNPCPRCGETNYALLGYTGAVSRWAKAWGVTKEEAERRMSANERLRWAAIKEQQDAEAAEEYEKGRFR